jgi:hypothetical protein
MQFVMRWRFCHHKSHIMPIRSKGDVVCSFWFWGQDTMMFNLATFSYIFERPVSGCTRGGCDMEVTGLTRADCALGLLTFVLDLANSKRIVWGRSGSNLTPCCNKTRREDVIPGLWLVETDHVTRILASDWSEDVIPGLFCCSKEWGSIPTCPRRSAWSLLNPTRRLASPRRSLLWSTLSPPCHSPPLCTRSQDVQRCKKT